MTTTRLSTKGQLILPKAVRDRHGWRPGTELEVEDFGESVVIRAAARVPETRLEDLVGCAGYSGPARTLEEMEEAVARGARERG
jgi:AbrB family looped-hinge helix DNA binding protein